MNKNKITLLLLYLIIFSLLSFFILNKVFTGFATFDSSTNSYAIQKKVPSPYAHKRIAEILLNYLIKEKLIIT